MSLLKSEKLPRWTVLVATDRSSRRHPPLPAHRRRGGAQDAHL